MNIGRCVGAEGKSIGRCVGVEGMERREEDVDEGEDGQSRAGGEVAGVEVEYIDDEREREVGTERREAFRLDGVSGAAPCKRASAARRTSSSC